MTEIGALAHRRMRRPWDGRARKSPSPERRQYLDDGLNQEKRGEMVTMVAFPKVTSERVVRSWAGASAVQPPPLWEVFIGVWAPTVYFLPQHSLRVRGPVVSLGMGGGGWGKRTKEEGRANQKFICVPIVTE